MVCALFMQLQGAHVHLLAVLGNADSKHISAGPFPAEPGSELGARPLAAKVEDKGAYIGPGSRQAGADMQRMRLLAQVLGAHVSEA